MPYTDNIDNNDNKNEDTENVSKDRKNIDTENTSEDEITDIQKTHEYDTKIFQTEKQVKKEQSIKYVLRNILIALIVGLATISLMSIFLSDNNLVDNESFLVKLFKIPFWLPILGSAVFILIYFIDALRLKIVLKALNEHLKFRYLIRNSLLGYFYNYVTPFAMGGQPYRIYDLKKHGVSLANASNSILSRFLSQTLVTIIISLCGYYLFSSLFLKIGATGSIFFIGFSISVFSTTLLFIFTISDKIKKFFFKILHLKIVKKIVGLTHYTPEQLQDKINSRVIEFKVSFKTLWKKKLHYMILDMILSIMILFLHALVLYLFIRYYEGAMWLSHDVIRYPTLFETVMIHYAMGFVVYYSPTPGSSGAIEWAYSSVFINISTNSSSLLAAVFLWRISTYYFPIVVGLITMIVGRKKKEINNKVTEDFNEV